LKDYIDRHRDDYGVEPICRVLQMAPSCYWRHAARQRNPQLRTARAVRDESLMADIQRVWHANWQVYGADKVWLQMNREGIRVARCTVERLMRTMGLQGARRGKTVRTTMPDTSAPGPLDHVNRQFKASLRIPRDGGHDSMLMADSVPPSSRTPFHGDGGQHSILKADTPAVP